jgi:glycerol-3-phosphate acyltransferase PlsY
VTRNAVLVLGAAYALGSIPFSYLVARFFGVADVRKVGSGNVGATNVMRSAGRGPGLLAFALDAAKGAAAAMIASAVAPEGWLAPWSAATAVLGHMYPVWLRFQGGKGVATGVGAFIPLAPPAALGGVTAFVVVLAATRYVSLGSIAGAVALPVVARLTGSPTPVVATAALVGALVIWKHRGNLARLSRGTESRLGTRRPELDTSS